jgi:hypothetical protein
MNLYERNGDPTLDTYLFAGLATALAFLSAYIGATARDADDTYAAMCLGFISIAAYCVALYVHSEGKLAEENRLKRVIKRADYTSLKNPPKPKAKAKTPANAKRQGLVIQCNSPVCTNTFVEHVGVGRKRKFCCRKCVSYTHNLKRKPHAR